MTDAYRKPLKKTPKCGTTGCSADAAGYLSMKGFKFSTKDDVFWTHCLKHGKELEERYADI